MEFPRPRISSFSIAKYYFAVVRSCVSSAPPSHPSRLRDCCSSVEACMKYVLISDLYGPGAKGEYIFRAAVRPRFYTGIWMRERERTRERSREIEERTLRALIRTTYVHVYLCMERPRIRVCILHNASFINSQKRGKMRRNCLLFFYCCVQSTC